MPTDVRCLVETDLPHPVLRLLGDLDTATVDRVRSALLHALLEQPEALVVDVSRLRVVDPAAVTVLADAIRQADDWCDARVVVCAAADGGAGPWSATGLSVCHSEQAALAALGQPRPRRLLTAELAPAVGAARRARELVTEACARWELPTLIGPACIVVTELVNNVVAHVQSAMIVGLVARDSELLVSVRDGSARLPRFTGVVAPTSYGGRGLLLIDSVASRWGTVPVDQGKVVWAVVPGDDDVIETAPGPPGRWSGNQPEWKASQPEWKASQPEWNAGRPGLRGGEADWPGGGQPERRGSQPDPTAGAAT